MTTHRGDVACERPILTHRKHLNRGEHLVDDRTKHGVDRFDGELVLFGSADFPDQVAVTEHLLSTR